MSWILAPVFTVIETRKNGNKKETTATRDCDSKERAKELIKEWSDDVIKNDIDSYYLDSKVRIDSYRWKIKKKQQLIWN